MRKYKFVILFLLVFFVQQNGQGFESKSYSVINLFNLLPGKYRSLEISRNPLSENPGLKKRVIVNDQKNDYLKLINDSEGEFTMAIWRPKSNYLVAGITSTGCGPLCEYVTFAFLRFDGTNWKDIKADIFPPIDYSLLEKRYNLKKSKDDEPFSSLWVQYELPRYGTTIKVTMQMSDVHLADLVWNGKKFIFKLI
jgi:hypothetical protein